jgi:hypothetical protein
MYCECTSFCNTKSKDLNLAYGTLDEKTFAHMTTLNIKKNVKIKKTFQKVHLHMK